jgi:hypothetical protein
MNICSLSEARIKRQASTARATTTFAQDALKIAAANEREEIREAYIRLHQLLDKHLQWRSMGADYQDQTSIAMDSLLNVQFELNKLDRFGGGGDAA